MLTSSFTCSFRFNWNLLYESALIPGTSLCSWCTACLLWWPCSNRTPRMPMCLCTSPCCPCGNIPLCVSWKTVTHSFHNFMKHHLDHLFRYFLCPFIKSKIFDKSYSLCHVHDTLLQSSTRLKFWRTGQISCVFTLNTSQISLSIGFITFSQGQLWSPPD